MFFLTGRPRTSECGFWFQVFPTFWPTLLSPTALGRPPSLQPRSLPNPDSGWETEGCMLPSLDVALFGFHESASRNASRKQSHHFSTKGEKNTQHFHGCARVKTPEASCVVWSLGSKWAPDRASEVKSFCLSIPLCLPLGHWGGTPDSNAKVVSDQQSSPTSMGIKLT